MANRTYKREKRLGLLTLIILFMFGSSLWLKLILLDTLSETLYHTLLYERERVESVKAIEKGKTPAEGKFYVAEGLQMSTRLSDCAFVVSAGNRHVTLHAPPPAPHASASATAGEVYGNGQLVDMSAFDLIEQTGDGIRFDQLNSPVPKCGVGSALIEVNATLDQIHDPVAALYFILYASNDFKTWWQANGAAGDEQNQVSQGEMFRRDNGTVSMVQTYGCISQPSFVYLVGCVHEGLPLTNMRSDTRTKPPFKDCIAIDSICGASCQSGNKEPSYNDPSKLDDYHDKRKKSMHCVVPESQVNHTGRVYKHGTASYASGNTFTNPERHAPEEDKQGVIRLDDLEHYDDIGLQPASYAFAVMYVLGVVSLFLMYVPGIGQREGVAPQWLRLKQTLVKGTVRMTPGPAGQPAADGAPSGGGVNGGARNGGGEGARNGANNPSRPTRQAPSTQVEPLLAAHKQPNQGVSTCIVSISASESPNIILRNALGKIVGNLRLMMEMGDTCATDVAVFDTFVDEGHRIGAYYLYRAIALTFYVCIKRPHALKIASEWLAKMNKSDAGENTDVFDKADLYKLLDDKTRDRSEIKLLQMIHGMFKVLNQFSDKVDALFDKMLQMPVFDAEKQARVSEFLKEHAQLPPILEQQALEVDDRASVADDLSDTASTVDFEPDEKRIATEFVDKFGFKNPKAAASALKVMRQEAALLRAGELFSLSRCLDVTIRDSHVEELHPGQAAGGVQVRDSMQPPSTDSMKRNFFHPVLWSKLGHLIVNGYEPTVAEVGDRRVPNDVAAYHQALVELGGCNDNVLDSTSWINVRPLFKGRRERDAMVAATSRRRLAFDHVEDVLAEVPHEQQHVVGTVRGSTGHAPMTLGSQQAARVTGTPQLVYVRAIYCARGNPTKWQPWTRNNHRRTMKAGTWICPKPKRVLRTHDEVRDRRELAREWWLSRKKLGLLEAGQRVHFYTDDGAEEEMEEPVELEDADKYELLNVHLGKAGGLNFGLQATVYLMFEAGLPSPSVTRPFFFAIIDARHANDERLWLNVLPAFFNADERAAVTFNPSVCLVQLAHSYLGMKHKTDVLDMANDFLFTGMAVIRNQSYGMTSCGTGGIWAVTSSRQLGEYFYGRTMIEDSSSSIEHFLRGRKSIYIAPYAGKRPEAQLMCAVPKVSANYLEALERWDTGAVQCLCAQALGRTWFWVTLSCILLLIASMLAPSLLPTDDLQELTSLQSLTDIFLHLLDHPYFIVLLVAIALWIVYVVAAFVFALFFTAALNYSMRMLVLFFNVTYPFNSVSAVFWIMIPPWICLSGKFPFKLQPIAAIAGSLALRLVEWLIVLKTKKESERNGTHLYEYSIFRSQQMNEVTVPIKLRAVFKGLSTGWDDCVKHKDNSFWVSFGTAQAVQWVQAWLAATMLAMVAALVGGTINLILGATSDSPEGPDIVVACVFGMVLAIIQIWILWEPAFYVLKGRTVKMSLRHTEVLVLLAIGFFVVFSATAASSWVSITSLFQI